jgi:hypothetical protein
MDSLAAFLRSLVDAAPQLEATLLEHKRANRGRVLSHVFMGDVTRFVIEHASDPSYEAVLVELIGKLETGLREGSDQVKELVLASFVENLAGETNRLDALQRFMGPHLKALTDDVRGE